MIWMQLAIFAWSVAGLLMFFPAKGSGSRLDVDIEGARGVAGFVAAGPAVWFIIVAGLLTGALSGSISNE